MRCLVAAIILLLALPAAAQDLDSLFDESITVLQEASVTPDEDRRDALLDEAIAAFRQMLVADPNPVRVRLELARAFFLKGEDSLARQHFEAVLAGGVPEPVAANTGCLNLPGMRPPRLAEAGCVHRQASVRALMGTASRAS